jgi:hypothetical protein
MAEAATVEAPGPWIDAAKAFALQHFYIWAPDAPGNLMAKLRTPNGDEISLPVSALPRYLRRYPSAEVLGQWTDDGLHSPPVLLAAPGSPPVAPDGSGGYLHTHAPIDEITTGSNPEAPIDYPPPPHGDGEPEWPTEIQPEPEVPSGGTEPEPPLPLVITPGVITPTATACTLMWSTNWPASKQVAYGLDATYGAFEPVPPGDTDPYELEHTVTVTGLTAATTYHYSLLSTTEVGEAQQTLDATFDTLP